MSSNNENDISSDQPGVTICPDSSRCMNYSNCTESIIDSQFSCTCVSNFVGTQCEIQPTSYCTVNNALSNTAFCANGGVCKQLVSVNSTDFSSCTCPRGYSGRHCEIISTSPTKQGSIGNMNVGKAVGIFFGSIGLVTLAVIVIYVYKRRKSRANYSSDLAHHSELELQQNESINFKDGDDETHSRSNKSLKETDGSTDHGMDGTVAKDETAEIKRMEEIDIL